ncbi:MAG TPA: methionine--tRNA ligase [Spirochaetota bacterium]|nr:methionine--tRNA ligase [Spirochaetota bacterium]HOM38542.1 methionine--tRNA ligase [Spirochaetota bacterium]HPQ49082.1 methionine--tRNA ligase [Spirochaetota bacterium]
MEKILVTSALPYANGPVHIGHLAGAYLPADIYVRFNRLMKNDVIYICGTDEHGVPITIRADEEKITPKEVVDKYHEMIKKSFDAAGLSFDNFSRTTKPHHYELSQRFFKNLLENGYIDTDTEKQLYCPDNGKFLPDRYIEGICPNCGYDKARGDECPKCGKWLEATSLIEPRSKLCPGGLILKDTKHWYLRLDKMQGKIEAWIKEKKWKDNVKNFIMGWLKEGLKKRPITRDLNWGVPLPIDDKDASGKVMYVWFDAPIGYISSTIEWAQKIGKPDKWKDYWFDKNTKLVHFIGKDNIPFHAIVWPAILMGQKESYILPSEIPANEHLTIEGEKISTSRGNMIYIEEVVDNFGQDYLRYYLAVNSPETRDTDFSWKNFQSTINTELINVFGNLINRVVNFVYNRFDKKVPIFYENRLTGYDEDILDLIKTTIRKVKSSYSEFRVRDVTKLLFNLAKSCNQYFQDNEPWKMIEVDKERVSTVLNICFRVLKALIILYYPIIPGASKKLFSIVSKDDIESIDLSKLEDIDNFEGFIVDKPEIPFKKVEDNQINRLLDILNKRINKIDNIMSENKSELSEENKTNIDFIDIQDFSKLDIRVGTVLEAKEVENSNKLIEMKVDIGSEIRTIIGGLKEYYKPSELINRKVIVLVNLKPRKLMGKTSEGMVLAAKIDGELKLLTVEGIRNGAKIS